MVLNMRDGILAGMNCRNSTAYPVLKFRSQDSIRDDHKNFDAAVDKFLALQRSNNSETPEFFQTEDLQRLKRAIPKDKQGFRTKDIGTGSYWVFWPLSGKSGYYISYLQGHGNLTTRFTLTDDGKLIRMEREVSKQLPESKRDMLKFQTGLDIKACMGSYYEKKISDMDRLQLTMFLTGWPLDPQKAKERIDSFF